MNAGKWVRDNAGLLFVGLILAVVSPIISDILPDGHISNATKAILIAGQALFVILAVRGEAQRQLAEKRSVAIVESLRGRGSLFQHLSEEVCELQAMVRDSFRLAVALNTRDAFEDTRKRCIREALKALCKVLESSSRAPDDNPLKAIYFKATMFEVNDNETELTRAYWHYPATMSPTTTSWNIEHDDTSGAVRAYLNGHEIVMQRVRDAAAEGKIWKDGWTNQRDRYQNSSMVCVPIWRDSEPGGVDTTHSRTRGVLTVDTNQLDYFRGDEDAVGFREQVFGPFIEVVRLAYTITEPGMREVGPT